MCINKQSYVHQQAKLCASTSKVMCISKQSYVHQQAELSASTSRVMCINKQSYVHQQAELCASTSKVMCINKQSYVHQQAKLYASTNRVMCINKQSYVIHVCRHPGRRNHRPVPDTHRLSYFRRFFCICLRFKTNIFILWNNHSGMKSFWDKSI